MSFTIHSPHSGQPVKVREQDLGRAIRDEGGRLFYVVQRAEGEGHYGSLTRKGSAQDETRYDNHEWKLSPQEQDTATQPTETSQAHDATGRRQPTTKRLVVATFVLVALLAGGYVAYRAWSEQAASTDVPAPQSEVDTAS